MMAWGRRTSIGLGIGLGIRNALLPSLVIGMTAIGSFAHQTFAQGPTPAPQTAAPAASEAPKEAKKKSNAKPAAEAKKDPAVAQQQIDAGSAALQAGKYDQAVQQFTLALTGSSLPAPLLARAHHQRGIAYRKLSKPALAIEDFTNALWLKNGLTESDRADAIQNRSAAYRDAGLPDQTDPESLKSQSVSTGSASKSAEKTAESGSSSTPSQTGSVQSTGSIPAPKASAVAPSPEPAPPASSGGVGAFFGNLFGGSSGSSAASAAAPAQKAEAPSWGADNEIKIPAEKVEKVKPASSAGAAVDSTQQSVQQIAKPPAKVANITPPSVPGATATAPAAGASSPAKSGARYALQVAQLKSREEAQSLAAQLKQELGLDLAGREPSIVAVSAGGFGTLHRLSFGPFIDAAEWKDLCPKLLKAGHDCLPLAQ
jgi:tetratricopeptide (TPR) repeat protein